MKKDNLIEISMRHEMPKFQTQSTYQGPRPEVIEGPSMTRPDMTYSISEILTRYANGAPLTQLNGLEYTGDVELPNIRAMDFVDRDELIARNKSKIEQYKKEIEDMRNKAAAKAKESVDKRKTIDDYYEKLIKLEEKHKAAGEPPTQ